MKRTFPLTNNKQFFIAISQVRSSGIVLLAVFHTLAWKPGVGRAASSPHPLGEEGSWEVASGTPSPTCLQERPGQEEQLPAPKEPSWKVMLGAQQWQTNPAEPEA